MKIPPLISSILVFLLMVAFGAAAPADAKLADNRSFLHDFTVSKDHSFHNIGNKYPTLEKHLSNIKDSPPPSDANTPQIGSSGFAGAEGGQNQMQTQAQNQAKTYPEEQAKYNVSSGQPMGKQMSEVGGSCPPGVFPTWSDADPTKNATQPTPTSGNCMASPPMQNTAKLTNPMDKAAWDHMAKAHMQAGTNHNVAAADMNAIRVTQANLANDLGAGTPQAGFDGGQAGAEGAAQGASEAMADAFNPTWTEMLILSQTPLLNVANEATGSACSASQPIKTYENAVYLVQQAYKNVYLPMAILLLLPGAVMTQVKGLVTGGVLNNQNDEDAVSPFTGILRSIIAIFLIPATQLIVSYSIDVGNSLQYEVARNINYLNIYMWGDEQVFRAPIKNAISQIKPANTFKVLGKMSQGPEKESGYESQGPATIMLQTMVNSAADSAAFGLVILCAFQITMACYLLLMGPIAAALYAWPGSTGSLFTRVFSNWVDAMINLALWRFWWCVVLLCIDTRLGWIAGLDVYTEWEMLMFLSFLTILCYVPFNPFDYKAGEMVSQIMSKSDQAVGQATSK